jgi:hypothetical protein
VGIVAAAAGALPVSEDGLAVAASAEAGLTVSEAGLADATPGAVGLTVVDGAAAAWVADNLRAWVDGRAE